MFQWTSAASDVAGCIQLLDKELAAPQLGPRGLLELNCPMVMVLERMQELGWLAGDRTQPHVLEDDPEGKVFSREGHKHYLQCLPVSEHSALRAQ